jgi:hypothetical protein
MFYFLLSKPGVAGSRRNAKGDGPVRRGKRARKVKRGRGRREPTYSQMFNKVSRDVRWLMSVVNVEDKYVDTSDTALTVTTTPTLTLLCPLSLGTTATSRNGQSIKTVSLYVIASYRRNTSSAQNFSRMTIVFDRQCLAAAPAYTDVFDSADPRARRVVAYSGRFVVVYDRLFAWSSTGSGPDTLIFEEMIPLGRHIKFNTGNNGTVADITENSLYAMHVSTEATNGPALTANYRMTFVDN